MGRYITLARRIKELRQGSGYTQQDLSRASGLSRSYISRLEMGDIALPSRDKLRALANSLGTSLGDLLQAAGFLDATAHATDLPDIRTYLRRKYGIRDTRVLQALEAIVESIPRGDGKAIAIRQREAEVVGAVPPAGDPAEWEPSTR